MPLRTVFDKLEDVPEADRALYAMMDIRGTQRAVLQIEGIDSHPAVVNLKTALEAQKTKAREATTRADDLASRFADIPDDFDHDAYEALKAAAEKGTKPQDPVELERLVQTRAERLAKKDKDDREKAEKRAKLLETQRDERERQIALNENLIANGVSDPVLLKYARATLASGTEVVEDDKGEVSVMRRDPETDTLMPITSFIKDWAASDEGKRFVGASQSAGGGAPGGDKNGSGRIDTGQFTKDNFNLTEFAKLKRTNPIDAKRIALACGKPEYVTDL